MLAFYSMSMLLLSLQYAHSCLDVLCNAITKMYHTDWLQAILFFADVVYGSWSASHMTLHIAIDPFIV